MAARSGSCKLAAVSVILLQFTETSTSRSCGLYGSIRTHVIIQLSGARFRDGVQAVDCKFSVLHYRSSGLTCPGSRPMLSLPYNL